MILVPKEVQQSLSAVLWYEKEEDEAGGGRQPGRQQQVNLTPFTSYANVLMLPIHILENLLNKSIRRIPP